MTIICLCLSHETISKFLRDAKGLFFFFNLCAPSLSPVYIRHSTCSQWRSMHQQEVVKKMFSLLCLGEKYVIFDVPTSLNQPYLNFLNFRWFQMSVPNWIFRASMGILMKNFPSAFHKHLRSCTKLKSKHLGRVHLSCIWQPSTHIAKQFFSLTSNPQVRKLTCKWPLARWNGNPATDLREAGSRNKGTILCLPHPFVSILWKPQFVWGT